MTGRRWLPKVNQTVILELPPGAEGGPQRYRTVVQEVEGGAVAVAAPLVEGFYVKPSRGSELVLHYSDPAAAYRLTGVVQRFERKGAPLLWIRPTEDIDRIQRRNFVRLDIRLPIQVRALREDKDDAERSREWSPGRTLDLSGGGLRMLAPDIFAVGQALDMRLSLAEGWIEARGRIVRRGEPVTHRGHVLAQYGIAFVWIDPDDQETIVRFVFEQQRRERQIRGDGRG